MKAMRECIISIHFLYTEEDLNTVFTVNGVDISIHFLYTEEDPVLLDIFMSVSISIHFLYTEEDLFHDQI